MRTVLVYLVAMYLAVVVALSVVLPVALLINSIFQS
jgi:hypothetical protein